MFVADDSVFIREGVKAMLSRQKDIEIVGEAEDFDGLVAGAEAAAPNVVVSDIRMPPNFHREGIEGCKLIRKRHPGTGIVILSQFDDPDYAIALLSEGAAGYAYLLKDRIAEGDQLARAIREVASGGSVLDPVIVSALMNPVRRTGGLDAEDDALLEMVAEGKPIKAIAAVTQSTPAAVEARVEEVFRKLAEGVTAGTAGALDRLRKMHTAITSREEQGESLSRLLPTGVADRIRARGARAGSRICLAEITEDNPNVWFELGFAIACGKEVVLICSAQRKTKFPFDIQHRTIITYTTESPSDFAELQKKITEKIKAYLEKAEVLTNASEISRLTTFEGLDQHEVVALAAITQNLEHLEGHASTWQIKRDMESSGFTAVAATLALKRLVQKSFVTQESLQDDNGNFYMGFSLTETGWNWVLENKSKFVLEKSKKNSNKNAFDEFDNEIPF